jgi:hypothetical protein
VACARKSRTRPALHLRVARGITRCDLIVVALRTLAGRPGSGLLACVVACVPIQFVRKIASAFRSTFVIRQPGDFVYVAADDDALMLAVGSPARTSSTICSTVNPCACQHRLGAVLLLTAGERFARAVAMTLLIIIGSCRENQPRTS